MLITVTNPFKGRQDHGEVILPGSGLASKDSLGPASNGLRHEQAHQFALRVQEDPVVASDRAGPSLVDLERRELYQPAWFSLLESRNVEVLELESRSHRMPGTSTLP
jgi:hypothetical protein